MSRFGLLGLLFMTLVALFPTLFSPFDPQMRVAEALLPPSGRHLFGTDEVGRDLLSRVLLGIRYTWLPAITIIGISLLVGSVIGLLSALCGGWLDQVVQRVTDVFFMVPSMLIAMAVAATLGPGLKNTTLAIVIVWWPWYAVIARAELKRLQSRPHYEAAVATGTKTHRLLLRYSLPGAVPAIVIAAALDVSNVVMTLSLMSFLGLGQPDPAPELGALVSRSLDSLAAFWWLPIMPGLAVFMLCLLANICGEGLRSSLRAR